MLMPMQQRTRQKHFSMIRDFHLADFFTLANAACGVGAVFLTMLYLQSGARAHFYAAAVRTASENASTAAAGSSAPWEFHPLSLLFIASGSMMISKTLRIPKL